MFDFFKKKEDLTIIKFYGIELNMNYNKNIKYYLDIVNELEDYINKHGDDKDNFVGYESLGKEYFHLFENSLLLKQEITPEMEKYLVKSSECYLEGVMGRLKYHNDEKMHTDEYKGEESNIGTFFPVNLIKLLDMAIMAKREDIAIEFLKLYDLKTTRFKRKKVMIYDYIFIFKEIILNKDYKKAIEIIKEQKIKPTKGNLEYPFLINSLENIIKGDIENFQKSLDKLIKYKEKVEKQRHDLFVIWPTLWCICIIAKQRGLKFEVDNRFLPKYCLDIY